MGAVAGPLFAKFPAAGIAFAVNGIKTGIEQINAGHWATGTFDIVTSIAPFLFKQGREPILKQIEGWLGKNNVKITPFENGGRQGYQIEFDSNYADANSIPPSRTPGLGDVSTLQELTDLGAYPGSEGVILDQDVIMLSEIWQLGQKLGGVELALTRVNGKYNLYSGAPNRIRVNIQAGERPVAHTHPPTNTGEYDTLPSSADINVLNDIWNANPNGNRPSSMIIWGPEPGNTTVYRATGTERITR